MIAFNHREDAAAAIGVANIRVRDNRPLLLLWGNSMTRADAEHGFFSVLGYLVKTRARLVLALFAKA